MEKILAAHDVGKAINPLSVEGQIEGGVVMSLGYALTEEFPLNQGVPLAKFGTLGLFRADKTPDVESIIVERNHDPLAYGAIGIGEITSIPTAPAVQGAYYKYDGVFRTSLPLEETAYRKKEKITGKRRRRKKLLCVFLGLTKNHEKGKIDGIDRYAKANRIRRKEVDLL